MFSFVADGITTATSILFPVFASYKALRTSDPALLAPWLMYFVTLSLLLIVENTFDFILSWVPFYAWFRLFIHLYLVMPGSQGATMIYREHIDPFLSHHEREIDDFISDAHERAKSVGLQYLKQAIEWAKVNVLGMPPRQPSPPPSRHASYAQTLLSRFNMPSARGDNDYTSLIAQALGGASALYSGNREAQAEELSASGTLIPSDIDNPEDRLSYLSAQRQRLQVLLQAFDREQGNLMDERDRDRERYSEGTSGLAKSRSEAEFDRIEREEIESRDRPSPIGRRTSQGWMPWNWGARPRDDPDELAYGKDPPYPNNDDYRRSQARSTGFDLGDR